MRELLILEGLWLVVPPQAAAAYGQHHYRNIIIEDLHAVSKSIAVTLCGLKLSP